MPPKSKLIEKIKYAFKRFSGIPIETDLSSYEAIAREAGGYDFRGMSDGEVEARARALRAELSVSPDAREAQAPRSAMPACFALAAEACRRRLGLEPYEQQIIAAGAMCAGKVAQLQTGEGKTLAAAIAASLCAMRDGCVHLITANDYLARRDAEWMRPIYESLGLSVASIGGGDPAEVRRAAYRSDIAYLTARELGFDYLRDGLAYSAADLVQAGFSSAIVDEADFILIDEARVPLVIAGSEPIGRDPAALDLVARDCLAADRAVRELTLGLDFNVDVEGRKVSLTLEGQARAESLLGTRELRESAEIGGGAPLFSRVHAALHARHLLSRDVDYIVKGGSIKLVDSFTGRVAEKRQWPWGIQAALEAKEGLAIGSEGRIYGSIAVQHLMMLYPRIAAMTATAIPAVEEFASAYGMGTVIVPPVRPSRRLDEPDSVFWDRESKRRAIAAEVAREHRKGRPVLVGTASVRESEELAAVLAEEGIDHVLLNAKNDEEEAKLIAAAGRRGAVTISTNMAGRGTDIRLGGEPELLELGGLYVIGADKHESRRIDDQLRGRAGRQGDPGLTRFFVSLEDGLFARYGARGFLPEPYRRPSTTMSGLIADPAVGKEVERAQSVVEGENALIRSSLRKYSKLLEYDRRYARELRDEALITRALPPRVEEALAAAGSPEILAASRPSMALAFMARLDAAWADHLALVEDVKEGMGLFRYGGREPGTEYVRIVAEAFEVAMRELIAAAIADCRAILEEWPSGAAPEGLPSLPSSTWTYAVEEDLVPYFDIGGLFRAKVL